jgi:phosphoribosylanthranilate isomerase
MIRVKICGLCRPVDAAAALEAGADYGGVILAPGRSRSQSAGRAAEIYGAAPGLRRAGVFVDAPESEIVETATRLQLDVVQLHGSEAPDLVGRVRAAGPWSVWKAIAVRALDDAEAAVRRYAGSADGLLADGWHAAGSGGTGRRFPWDVVAPVRSMIAPGTDWIVAGGLDADNVADAVRVLRPDVVDVSSGVERIPGEKSTGRIRAFVSASRAADRMHGASEALDIAMNEEKQA